MFIVQVTYKAPLTEVDKYLRAHREFLDCLYKKNLLLASGPMNPRTGGILIALTKDKAFLESVLKEDPFYLADIADYEFIEFFPLKHRDEIKKIVQETEDILC